MTTEELFKELTPKVNGDFGNVFITSTGGESDWGTGGVKSHLHRCFEKEPKCICGVDPIWETPKDSLFIEEEKVFKQEILLPGVKKESISIKVTADKFTLEHKETSKYFDKGYKVKYSLPKYGKIKELKATMKDGILIIVVPKKIVEFEVKVQ